MMAGVVFVWLECPGRLRAGCNRRARLTHYVFLKERLAWFSLRSEKSASKVVAVLEKFHSIVENRAVGKFLLLTATADAPGRGRAGRLRTSRPARQAAIRARLPLPLRGGGDPALPRGVAFVTMNAGYAAARRSHSFLRAPVSTGAARHTAFTTQDHALPRASGTPNARHRVHAVLQPRRGPAGSASLWLRPRTTARAYRGARVGVLDSEA